MKRQGTLNIICDTDTKSPAVSIDGKIFSMKKWGQLLVRFEGSQMQYRIIDQTDPVLSENEMLVSVKVGVNDLLEELESLVFYLGLKMDLFCIRMLYVFETMFNTEIYDKLKLLFQLGKNQKRGVVAAEKIIEN